MGEAAGHRAAWVGQGAVVRIAARRQPPFWVVFEDAGDTGYLYALDAGREENPIFDALHIYIAREGDADRARELRLSSGATTSAPSR